MDARVSAELTPLFVTAPRGVDDLLAEEVATCGATAIQRRTAGVACTGTLAQAYRICLWSRLANRVLWRLADFAAPNPEELYEAVRALDWSAHLAPGATLAVDFTSVDSAITHTHFGALKVKDAIVDQLREATGERPSIDVAAPSVRVNVYVERDHATLCIDLSGTSLHQRGYRLEGVAAPLKENLAAAVLLRSRWPAAAAAGATLLDPMCGSGTLPIEAALMALDIAPGLARTYFGFLGWRGHDAATWEALVAEAKTRRRSTLAGGAIVGSDHDPGAIRAARTNVEAAGLSAHVELCVQRLTDCTPPGDATTGLVVVNPPYGERLGERRTLAPLYAELGHVLKHRFANWTAHVLSPHEELAQAIGLRANRENTLYNGALECRLLHYSMRALRQPAGEAAAARPAARQKTTSPGAEMLANRLRKNEQRLRSKLTQAGVTCYRLYDADLPEYAAAIDVYEQFAHVQEYAAPKTIDEQVAAARFRDILVVASDVLGLPRERVFAKVRRKQKGASQYTRREQTGAFHAVHEGGHTFLVNFEDYLDTGLFLDHRLVRRLIGELAAEQHVLNLFCYTGTATVYAAKGGARSTTSVDLSNTYLEWAERNFAANTMRGERHRLLRADCREVLREQQASEQRYGLIFLDPPTFSNSASMQGTLDVQRDHGELLRAATELLTPKGVLIFSNNFRRFRMQADVLPEHAIEDITAATLPFDFARSPRIHQCWRITRR